MAIFSSKPDQLRRLTKELLASDARKVTARQLKRWKSLMNSTDGELLKEVLMLEELSANPKVGLMLLGALPQWLSDVHAAYLEALCQNSAEER